MAEKLSLDCHVNTPYVPITSRPRLVYVLLEVNDSADGVSFPVNLGLVVDVSESMHIRLATDSQFEELARAGVLKETLVDGVPAWQSTDVPRDVIDELPRKIDRVKDALQIAVEQLRPVDRFSLVAFAGQAVTLIPNTAGSQKRCLLKAIDKLDKLRLGDETYIAPGIALGFEDLRQHASSDLVDRLLVLTDGFAFDEKKCRAWAVRARRNRIPISTMGLGGEFNEELMIPIADRTGGEAYLLEKPDDIPPAFARELQRAQSVCYRNLELKLRPTRRVEIRAAYRVRPSISPLKPVNGGGSYSFPLGNLIVGEKLALLLELIVPPGLSPVNGSRRSPGMYRLAQALLAYDNPGGGAVGVKVREDVVVQYMADAEQEIQTVSQVMRVVEAVSAYKLQQEAQAELETGNVTKATRKLRAAATRLLDMGEEDLAAEMEQQAVELEQAGEADPHRTKRLRYETRKLTQKLG